MVGVLISLKLATLRHAWRGGQSSMLWMGACAGLVIAAWSWSAIVGAASLSEMASVAAVSFGVWALIWLSLPIMGGSGGDPLQPDLFRLLPIPPRRLALSLLGASAVGVLPLVTIVGFASVLSLAMGAGLGAVLVGMLAVGLALAFVIALSKVVVYGMGAAAESRLGLELAAIQYALVLCLSLIWLPLGIIATTEGASSTIAAGVAPRIEQLARLLPTGWAAVAVELAVRGEWWLAVATLAGLAGLTGALVLAWSALLARRLRGMAATRAHSFRPARVWDSAPLPSTPFGAVVGKELRGWARHPRRVLELRVAIWTAVLLVLLPGLVGAREVLWPWAGAVVVVVASVGLANVYGMDGSSIWLTMQTATARQDVRGRQAAWLLVVGALAVATTVVLTAAAAASEAWPWVLAVVPALLGAGAGLGAVVALWLPAPLPERRGGDPLDLGDAPTTQGRLMLQGILLTIAVPLLAAPAAAVVWLAPPPAHWLGIAAGLILGALYAWGLGQLAASHLARNGPELLLQLRMRATAVARPPTGGRRERSVVVSTVSVLLMTIGAILLVPQGLVALAFALADIDVRLWFAALYLPDAIQVPASVLIAAIGAATLLAAWRMRQARPAATSGRN